MEKEDLFEIRSMKEFNVNGAVLIHCIPSMNVQPSIVASYLVETLNMDQIACCDSHAFPPASMIYGAKPKFPARAYVNQSNDLVVFISEVPAPAQIARNIAQEILDWSLKNKIERVISLEGIPTKAERLEENRVPKVYGVGSTDNARAWLAGASVDALVQGIILGVSGVLLNEARFLNFDVVTLVAEFAPDMPDARAAARVIETIQRMLPELKIDVEPLYQRATLIERQVRTMRNNAEMLERPAIPSSPLYR